MVAQYPDRMVFEKAYGGGGFNALSDPIPALTAEVTSRCRIESKGHPRQMQSPDSLEYKESFDVFLPSTASIPVIGVLVQLFDRAGSLIETRAVKSIYHSPYSIKILV